MTHKYIQFNSIQVGDDGREYYSGVKYRIVSEGIKYIYLNGENGQLNKFSKEDIKEKSQIGNIISGGRT